MLVYRVTKNIDDSFEGEKMKAEVINQCGDALYDALVNRTTIKPFTDRFSDISIEDGYHISKRMLDRRLSAGATIIGKKIGATSKAVQNMLNVQQPDFGYLTNDMVYANRSDVPISQKLIQPRAEGEIGFVLKSDLTGPGVTNIDVLRATEYVLPCFEIVDSRIDNWQIKIEDTVADNASSGLFVMGDAAVDPHSIDLAMVGMVVEKNGRIISTGAGAAALGSPLTCVAWLANTLGQFGIPLRAGEIILSGSLVPLEPVEAGDFMRVEIGGIGSASVQFV
jgi:2-oxopent-4-enoate/cis-2-oxohex-4-enoate hydratase